MIALSLDYFVSFFENNVRLFVSYYSATIIIAEIRLTVLKSPDF